MGNITFAMVDPPAAKAEDVNLNSSKEALARALEHWRRDPCEFVEDVFGVIRNDTWWERGCPDGVSVLEEWQEKALLGLRRHHRLSIRSGKGVGKTAFLSWVMLWFLAVKEDAKVACTATSAHQLYDVLWKELQKWIRLIPENVARHISYEWRSDTIECGNGNFGVARTARREQPEALQGFHARNMLFIADEASGIDDEVFFVGEGAMSTEGAITVLTGNPTRPSGYFYNTFHKDRKRWWTLRVGAEESRQVSRKYIEEQREAWGEESNEYRIGVLGEFPLGGSQAIISLHLIEAAVGRDVTDNDAQEVWGLDVARFGNDRTALAKRKGRCLRERVQWWQGKDLMETCGIVADQYFSLGVGEWPVEIVVDALGLGGGLYDRLREMRMPVRALNAMQRRSVAPAYLNIMTEMWFEARLWFESMMVSMPDDPDLVAELSQVEYAFNSTGKKFIPDKKLHVGRSPDLAEAFILTFGSWRDKVLDGIALAESRHIKPQYAESDASYIQEYEQWGQSGQEIRRR